MRPTSDRLRELIFDILTHAYDNALEGATVVDLFAGTGALGIEALSRGAARALFIDDGAEARALLRANIEALGLGGVTRVFRRDATRLGLAPPGEALRSPFWIRLMARRWRRSRSANCFAAAGLRRARSW